MSAAGNAIGADTDPFGDFGDAAKPRTVTAEVIEHPCERCGTPVPTVIRYAGRVWGRKGRTDQSVSCSATCRTMLSRQRRAEYEATRADYVDAPRHVVLRRTEIKRSRKSRPCEGGCQSMISMGEPAVRIVDVIGTEMRTRYVCGFCKQ